MNWNSLFTSPAVAGILLSGAIVVAAPASAHDPKLEVGEHRDVIVKRMHRDGAGHGGERDLAELRTRCRNADRAESDVTSGEGKDKFRTRIIVCGDGDGPSPATRARLVDALEKARAKLSTEEELNSRSRAEAVAALEREIERLRGQGQ